MKQVSHRGYLLVEVPWEKTPYGFTVEQNNYQNEITCTLYWKYGEIEISREVLPLGQWEIIGKGNEIKEEVWEDIAECISAKNDLWKRYDGNTYWSDLFKTATESGHSLIKSHGMKPETTLILKLKTNE